MISLPCILHDWIEIVFLDFRGFPEKSMEKHKATVTTIAFDFIGPLPRVVNARFTHTHTRARTRDHTYIVPSLFPYVLWGSFSRGTRIT